MAEILWLQRGNYRAADDFETFMKGQLYRFERTMKSGKDKGKKVITAVQGGLREYKIMGYAIPDTCVDRVLNGLEVGDGVTHPIQAKIATTFLRKAMGAEKIPKVKDREKKFIIIPREGVAIYMIGVKRDETSVWLDNKTGEKFEQENL